MHIKLCFGKETSFYRFLSYLFPSDKTAPRRNEIMSSASFQLKTMELFRDAISKTANKKMGLTHVLTHNLHIQ